ncbi:MAG: SDR family oxidoreductase [Dongiaceae bacterium]
MSGRPVALVTGAGRGIGAASARELHARGYDLALMSPSDNALRLAAELGGRGLRGEVESEADLAALVALARDAFGRVDAVVMSMGHAPWSVSSGLAYDPALEGHLLDIPDADWSRGVESILLGAIRLCRLVTPLMLERRQGSIVLISSFTAREPRLCFPISSVVRPALAGFVKLYADRYARDGLRINLVLPGFIDNWPADEVVVRSIPMARRGSVEEVAKTVAFLLSADAGYITGQSLLVDGAVNRGL